MTQAIGPTQQTYTLPLADGAAVPWRYLAASDHNGAFLDAAGNVLFTAIHGTHFTVLPEGDTAASAGTLALLTEAPAGATLFRLERQTLPVQLYEPTPGAEGVATALDRLTLQAQEDRSRLDGTLRVFGTGGNPIVLQPGQVPVWSENGFVPGPTAEQVAAAQEFNQIADLRDQAAASALTAEQARDTAETYLATLVPDRRRAFAALSAPPAIAQVSHVMQIGQSLAIGSNGTPIIHATPLPANMLTFAGGPKAIPVAAGGSAPDTASFKAMVEDTVSPDGGGSRGETGLWNAAYALAEALAEERASTAALGDFVFTAPGIGGQSISYFAKSASGSSWWQQRFRAHILAAQAIATAAGKTFCVPVIFWAQGEANAGVTSTEASYATALRTLFTDMADEVLAITGQTQRPHFVTYFTGYGTLEGHANTTNRAGTLGQLKTLAGALDVHQGVPVYALPHAADGTHLTAEGYAMMGRAFGEALADIMVRNRYPRQVWPVSAVMAEGCRNVVVKFRAPEAGVERDDTAIPATTNAGFVVHDGAGVAATISGVTVAGDEVTLALANFLPSLGAVRYACDTRAPAVTDPVGVSVATGNLRAAGYDLPVHGSAKRSKLWCPPFIRSILPPPSGLVWPGFEAVGAGGGHWLFDQSGGHLTDRVNARVITDNGGLSAGTKGLAISGVFGQGGTTDIDDAAQLTICAVVLTNNDYGLVAGALTTTTGSALLRTQTGGHAFSRTSGGSRTAAQNPGAVSGDWRFMSSVEDFAATDLRVRCANLAGNTSLAGVTKVLNTVNKIGIGSRYWNNSTYNKPVELVELIIFPSALSAAQITEVYQRSVARIALSREVAVK